MVFASGYKTFKRKTILLTALIKPEKTQKNQAKKELKQKNQVIK